MRAPSAVRLASAALAVSCALAVSGCGAKQDTISAPSAKSFSVMLDWFPNADHAALYWRSPTATSARSA